MGTLQRADERVQSALRRNGDSRSTTSNSGNSSNWRSNLKTIAALFELYQRDYGGLWLWTVNSSGMTVVQMGEHWAKRLADLGEAEIRRVGQAWRGEKPPNVMELRAAVLATTRSGAHRPFAALPAPRADPQIARAALAAMDVPRPGQGPATQGRRVRRAPPPDTPVRAERRRRIERELKAMGVEVAAGA